MFEPVHGSAGRGIANPVGQIWTAKLLPDFFDLGDLGELVLDAIERTLQSGVKTPDLGGRATTQELGDAIVERILAAAVDASPALGPWLGGRSVVSTSA